MIDNLIKQFLDEHEISNGTSWQSTEIDNDTNPMCELEDVYIKLDSFDINENIKADLPWAENHFLERVNGKPINPGNEYKNWPYWDKFSDEAFKDKGVFDHNYMERIWCGDLKGRRFKYGDLNDVIKKLKTEPNTRQAFLSIWHPEDQLFNKGVRVPCTIGYWFKRDSSGMLNVTYLIRSCDIVRHLRNDIYMCNRLLQHVAEQSKMTTGNVKMWIGNLHCFKSDLYYLKNNLCAEYK